MPKEHNNENKKWCPLEREAVERELNTDLENGLSASESKTRLEKEGANEFKKGEEATLFDKIIKQFKDPLVLILLLAGIATVFLHHYIDASVIFIALIINVAIGSFQEERASKAFEKLNESQEKHATVLRGGEKLIIPSRDLIPGDIVLLEAGSYIPADIYLLNTKNLSVNEAALTGEWMEVSKKATPSPKNAALTQMHNMAWMGTFVTGGSGMGIVVETGQDTQIGKIAEELGKIDEGKTPLQRNISKIARFLIYVISAAIIAIFAIGIWRGQPLTEMIILSIAIAVAAMPQGLPAAVTATLAIGMEKMLKKGGLVRNLRAAETLGSTTIILTDKTGTLTEAKMRLLKIITLNALNSPKEKAWGEDEKETLKMAVQVSDAFIERQRDKRIVRGEPMERAMLNKFLSLGFSFEALQKEEPQHDFTPFESKRGFTVSLNKKEGGNAMYINGIPEKILEMSSKIYTGGEEKELTREMKERIIESQSRESARGMRIIASAYTSTQLKEISSENVNIQKELPGHEIVFAGLLVFEDPVRSDVPSAVKKVENAGATVVMLTGDNAATAQKVAKEVGIVDKEVQPLTGTELEGLSDDELAQQIKERKVFARILPQQKLKIARVLKNRGEVVAMTGDGVNDAPALQSASIGVSVGAGTEVAKEASDMVLLNNSFAIITKAIEEGRKIIDNLKKTTSYLLSTSFSEIIVIGGSLIAAMPVPLLPTQILWANIIEEGLMSFAFAFEKKEKGLMNRNPRSARVKEVLTPNLKKMVVAVSVITGAMLFGIFALTIWLGLPIEKIRTIMFVALSIDSILFAFSLKNFDEPVWRINFLNNKYLAISLTLSILLLIAAVTLPPLQVLLSIVPLTWWQIGLLLLAGIFDLLTIELTKYYLFKKEE